MWGRKKINDNMNKYGPSLNDNEKNNLQKCVSLPLDFLSKNTESLTYFTNFREKYKKKLGIGFD